MACEHTNPQIVRILLEEGKSNPNNLTNFGKSALHFAVLRGNLEMVNELLIFNTNPFIVNNENKTAREIASDLSHQNIYSVIKKYEKDGSFWSPEVHFMYPSVFKLKLFTFLVSQKIYFQNNKILKFPKPLLFQNIIKYFSISYFN